MEELTFEEYCREVEPDGESKSYAWSTAIGLQAMEGLQISKYLIDTAIQNISGGITIKEARNSIEAHYEENTERIEDRKTEEADKLAVRALVLLTEGAFSFSVNTYISIHRKLFEGMEASAGNIRDYNIKRKEWVLDGESILYAGEAELREMLECLFMEEKDFCYKGLSMQQIIRHFAEFISELWQIHAFSKGSTRVTAIFFIKYLESLGFSIRNNTFAENPAYFRNALVRANYSNLQKGLFGTSEYLELFLRNLILNEQNPLQNESLHISVDIQRAEEERHVRELEAKKEKERLARELEAKKEEERIIRALEVRKEVERVIRELEVNISSEKVDIENKEVNIENKEANIENKEANIQALEVDIKTEKEQFEMLLSQKSGDFSTKTISHILKLFEEFGFQKIFGRTIVTDILDLKNSGGSKFLLNLLQADIIENVSGYGKGKYRFKRS